MRRTLLLMFLLLSAGCERSVRFATCDVPLSRDKPGQLLIDLSDTGDEKFKHLADVLQRTNPDVLLLTDVDHDTADRARFLFAKNYLGVTQIGAPAIRYPYDFNGPVNSGVASGFDLNHDGKVVTNPGTPAYSGDAMGPGLFPGQHGMVLLSRFPIDTKNIRTFTRFKWKDMPDAKLPQLPDDALGVLRLASTSFWDVPITVEDNVVHILVSRPQTTDANRNHDMVRFWLDYLSGGKPAKYIVDDTSQHGGYDVQAGTYFVIMGQQKSDAIEPLLQHPLVNGAASKAGVGVLVSKDLKVVQSKGDQDLTYLDLRF